MCGEKTLNRVDRVVLQGSPPRMRGKEQQLTNAADQVRITPAHAGKRSCHTHQRVQVEDHPRTCGEKVVPDVCTT